jgi:D-ribulokinase
MADATGIPVVLPDTAEPVLLGAAMLGAVAAGAHASLSEAMTAMARDRLSTAATRPEMREFHRDKRKIHAEMRGLERRARGAMERWSQPS